MSDITLISSINSTMANFQSWADKACQGTLAFMTPWLGLMQLAKAKYWVGILAVLKACLAHSGDMRQGNRNALLKLGMWRLWGLAEKGDGGRELVLMVEREQIVLKDM